MSRETVLEQLQRLGMTGYEAKAYAALIAAGTPITGYEVAKRSHVPRSTVYETLGKLSARGTVFEVIYNGTAAYIALPPDALVAGLRRRFDESTQALEEALPAFMTPAQAHVVQHLTGKGPVLDCVRTIVKGVERNLYLALWDSEVRELAPEVRDAEERGVVVFLLAFGDTSDTALQSIPHRLITTSQRAGDVDRRLLAVAADRREALVGGAVGDRMSALYSDDPAINLVVVEYVRHDIALQQLAAQIGVERVTEIWQQDDMLRRLAAQAGVPGAGPTLGELEDEGSGPERRR